VPFRLIQSREKSSRSRMQTDCVVFASLEFLSPPHRDHLLLSSVYSWFDESTSRSSSSLTKTYTAPRDRSFAVRDYAVAIASTKSLGRWSVFTSNQKCACRRFSRDLEDARRRSANEDVLKPPLAGNGIEAPLTQRFQARGYLAKSSNPAKAWGSSVIDVLNLWS